MALDPLQLRALLALGRSSIEQGLESGGYAPWSDELPVPGPDASHASFAPLERREFASLTLQISVLGPLEPIAAASDRELIERLRPQLDGLVLSAAGRATFLPAVWEQLPEPESFVRALARKAGWPADQWPERVTAYRYTTESFGT